MSDTNTKSIEMCISYVRSATLMSNMADRAASELAVFLSELKKRTLECDNWIKLCDEYRNALSALRAERDEMREELDETREALDDLAGEPRTMLSEAYYAACAIQGKYPAHPETKEEK